MCVSMCVCICGVCECEHVCVYMWCVYMVCVCVWYVCMYVVCVCVCVCMGCLCVCVVFLFHGAGPRGGECLHMTQAQLQFHPNGLSTYMQLLLKVPSSDQTCHAGEQPWDRHALLLAIIKCVSSYFYS